MNLPTSGPGATEPGRTRPAVCLFIPQLAIGGSERQLVLLARGLASQGFDPVILTNRVLDGMDSTFNEAALPVHVLGRGDAMGLGLIPRVARAVRDRRAPLIHAWLWAANWRSVVARLFVPRARVIMSVRSMENDIGWIHETVYRLLTPMVAAVIVNSRAVGENHARRTRTRRNKYHIIPNGIDIARLDTESALAAEGIDDEESPIVGFVGRLVPRKRAETLARIAPRVLAEQPRVRFVIVGDGPSRADVLDECRRMGVANRFILLGARDRVARYLNRMSVFVNPGRGEGACNALLEAMALRVPVVAYSEGGNVDTIRNGETGYLVPDGDEDLLRDSILRILSRPNEARGIGTRARAFVHEHYSVSSMVSRTASLYRDVLEGRSAVSTEL